MSIFKQFDKVVIKTVRQLLDEGWEPIPWGWLKNRSSLNGDVEISYYNGIEKILGSNRILTVRQDDGDRKYIHCVETDYQVAREAIGMVIPTAPVDENSVLANAGAS